MVEKILEVFSNEKIKEKMHTDSQIKAARFTPDAIYNQWMDYIDELTERT